VSDGVRIEELRELSDDLVPVIRGLVAQLSSRAYAPEPAQLRAILESEATRLLVARALDGSILGMLTLALYRISTGMCAWIEDVVVDEQARGCGIGEALTNAALRLASEHGADHVDLTSRSSREAANRLYQRLGFEPRETNVHRFEIRGG
jgi:ribosomal protein S18 acetylase RimI-like enzyme